MKRINSLVSLALLLVACLSILIVTLFAPLSKAAGQKHSVVITIGQPCDGFVTPVTVQARTSC